MRKPALVFVEFLPAFDGEVALLSAAEQLATELTVAILVGPGDSLEFEVRRQWVKALVPAAHVVPFEPAAFENDHDASRVRRLIAEAGRQPIARLVSLRTGLERLAGALSADHAVLDPEREAFPADPEDIRSDICGHWWAMPETVRRLVRRRIALVGPECAGKSTMGAFLAERYGIQVVPEYGRFHSKIRQPGDYSIEELEFIDEISVAIRKVKEHVHGPLLLEDTDTILQIAWAKKLHGTSGPGLEENLALADHYFVFAPDIPWVDDPVRSMTRHEDRQELFDILCRTLEERRADFTIVRGDRALREATCAAVVEAQLSLVASSFR